ncbi:MAG: DEAD/DEAH box helicase, partial [Lachnospiraceae bacterium]|nr:DEAD/DEAH box helicase [Lachnospiraceae bacterium]
LQGSSLDQFYALTEGSYVECKDKQKNTVKNLKVGHRDLRIPIAACPKTTKDGKLIGVDLSGSLPALLEGGLELYMLGDGFLSQVTSEEIKAISPFIAAAKSNGDIRISIGKSSLSEYYYRILPELLENPYIAYDDRTGDGLDDILPPQAKFRFLLETDDYGEILCHSKVSYEGRDYDLTPSENLEGQVPETMAEDTAKSYRDNRQENRVLNVLKQYFAYNATEKFFFAPDTEEMIYRLLTEAVPELSRFGEVLGSKEFRLDALRPAPKINIGISVESGLMDISFLSKDISPDELLDVFESYHLKKKYYRLKSGDFINLDASPQLAELDALMDSLNLESKALLEEKVQLPIYRALYLNKMLEEHEGLSASRDKTYRALVKNFNTIRDCDYEPPESLKEVLRPYQIYGFKWLRTLDAAGFGGILADEMGLGKTLQIISLFLALLEETEKPAGPFLIVCPASLVYNWQEEFARFAPSISTKPIAGPLAERKKCFAEMGKNEEKDASPVFITSYDTLRSDVARYAGITFAAMVIDEAQYIKNQKAGMTKAVKSIKATHRYALTGTPIENKLAELWSIFDFLMPGFLYKYEEFLNKFETPIAKNKDENMTKRLKQMVSPFILRRLKTDVLKDLPAKLEEVRYARFEDAQKKLYDAQVLRLKSMIGDTELKGKEKIQIFAELMRIRQICCDPSLVFSDYDGDSAKRDACLTLIKSAIEGGHRMLVFSQFTSMLEILEASLKEEGIEWYKITGSTPKEKRITLVHDFNEGDVPVFLISLKAGGPGLNLTGADIVIHYDPWWNLAVQNQATDRAHRIGQTKQVTVYKIIVKDTIEEKILKLQEAKKDLAEAILSGEEQSLFKMSGEELLELLN